MTRNKKIILLLVPVILIIGALIYVLIAKKSGHKETAPPTPEEKISVPTNQGSVAIPDITKNPIENLSDGGVTFKLSDDFSIEYYAKDNSFIITLLNNDVEKAQKEAEQEFLQSLGVSQDDACKLNVIIGVPFSVNENFAGGVYKLSFCPGGKILGNSSQK